LTVVRIRNIFQQIHGHGQTDILSSWILETGPQPLLDSTKNVLAAILLNIVASCSLKIRFMQIFQKKIHSRQSKLHSNPPESVLTHSKSIVQRNFLITRSNSIRLSINHTQPPCRRRLTPKTSPCQRCRSTIDKAINHTVLAKRAIRFLIAVYSKFLRFFEPNFSIKSHYCKKKNPLIVRLCSLSNRITDWRGPPPRDQQRVHRGENKHFNLKKNIHIDDEQRFVAKSRKYIKENLKFGIQIIFIHNYIIILKIESDQCFC
jgi:hypothetical protein